ncbi:Wzz/FepE/Etk N-terminal domain-containing protein [Alistipes sp. CHKCI003]|uniref:Wzz/FepE/Etk N-terminal domain-containing protein n=1 Tax=Alistipes sp. CHKCI003 TaxID=1780376 RepID=UPI0007A81AC9|nr:Wzz/FepE/Etk N-terminal domain-containing protein [Alistipes sp. CHKCI003]CVI71414.1 Tyrosine-protein kinase etk [Alistipes sp. CHKCI003]
MQKNNTDTTQQPEEREIDLIDLIRKLWLERMFILKVTGVFILLGLLTALTGSKEYTASCQFVPQTSKNANNSSMARLASLAGINMGSLATGEQLLSPLVYPNVLNSIAFKRDLLQTQIRINGEEEPITLLTYLSDKKYRKFSLTGTILKYTVGLPGLIVHAIKGEPEEQETIADESFVVLTKEEYTAVRALESVIGIEVEEKKGYIALSAQMPEPYAAAQVAESALELLQKYITEFKVDKVQSNLEFIQERYDELKKEYEEIQEQRAAYKDANQGISTSRARTNLEKLDNQYNLAYSIYSEMATQLEQAKIQVKETTPILTVIDPVSMPIKPSKPRKMMILVGFTFLGGVAACGYVLIAPTLREAFASARRKDGEEPQPEESAKQ